VVAVWFFSIISEQACVQSSSSVWFYDRLFSLRLDSAERVGAKMMKCEALRENDLLVYLFLEVLYSREEV
jgi:hypothetical protein